MKKKHFMVLRVEIIVILRLNFEKIMQKIKPEIIFFDDDIIIVNKPANYLTIPDRHDATKPSVSAFLKEKFEEIFIVHRIDKETSGIICFARNEHAHRYISLQFEKRECEKIYLALVEGKMMSSEGTIDKPIAESQTTVGKMVIANRGKTSITKYKVLEYFNNFSLVECEILTGRMHQIRIHLQSIGYPLAIDSMYGRKGEFFLSDVKHKKFKLSKDAGVERAIMSRSTLHAYKLTINHPTSGEKVTFFAEIPKDFDAVVSQIRKWKG
jgi:23S rRNA pseudouridine1911/1915/1917 synthase